MRVEIKDDEKFFTRQVQADENGNFKDMYYDVKNGKITKIKSTQNKKTTLGVKFENPPFC